VGHTTFAEAIPKFHSDVRKRWWSCWESNPPLYQAICLLAAGSFRLVPLQSRLLPAVSFWGLDGVNPHWVPTGPGAG